MRDGAASTEPTERIDTTTPVQACGALAHSYAASER